MLQNRNNYVIMLFFKFDITKKVVKNKLILYFFVIFLYI